MAVKRFVSTGYKPLDTPYFAPSGEGGTGAVSTFYIIRLDEDGVPYYAPY